MHTPPLVSLEAKADICQVVLNVGDVTLQVEDQKAGSNRDRPKPEETVLEWIIASKIFTKVVGEDFCTCSLVFNHS